MRRSALRLIVAGFLALLPLSVQAQSEQAVTVQTADGLALAATLFLPQGSRSRVPGALLIQGSGPSDRDGNQAAQWRPSTLRRIASVLGSGGIASLRFDKRGMYANVSQRPRDPSRWQAFFRWENFVSDAAAAFNTLAGHSRVAPGSLVIVGHSEGGLIALDLVGRLKTQTSGVVLLATPGRSPGELLTEQVARILDMQGASPAQKGELLSAQKTIHEAIKENGAVPASMPAGLATLYPPYLGTFLQSFLALKPARLLQSTKTPFLAIIGSADVQISADRDGTVFARAAETRSDGSRYFELERSNHVLQATASPHARDLPIHTRVKTELVAFVRAVTSAGAQQ